MDKDLPAQKIFSDSCVEVGLSWKKNYLGKKGPMEGKVKWKELHVEINAIRHQQNLTTLSNKYCRPEKGFPGGQNMWLLPVKNKTEINHSNEKLMKAVLSQKSFLEVIHSYINTYILTLDTKTGNIDSLRMMIKNWHQQNIIIYLSSCR